MLLGLLEVDAQAIRANKKGQLAYISRRRGLVCLGLLDVDAQAIKTRQDGATCIHFKAQGLWFVSGCWMWTHRRSRPGRMGNLHTFEDA